MKYEIVIDTWGESLQPGVVYPANLVCLDTGRTEWVANFLGGCYPLEKGLVKWNRILRKLDTDNDITKTLAAYIVPRFTSNRSQAWLLEDLKDQCGVD